jgi:hypothetical protein
MFPLDDVLIWELFSHGIVLLAFVYLAYRYWWRRR